MPGPGGGGKDEGPGGKDEGPGPGGKDEGPGPGEGSGAGPNPAGEQMVPGSLICRTGTAADSQDVLLVSLLMGPVPNLSSLRESGSFS